MRFVLSLSTANYILAAETPLTDTFPFSHENIKDVSVAVDSKQQELVRFDGFIILILNMYTWLFAWFSNDAEDPREKWGFCLSNICGTGYS